MKKEKSDINVVITHIITTSLVIPFFGLFAGYVAQKLLASSVQSQILMLLMRDFVYILFFFFGVKYSLSYIDKNIIVKHPQKVANYSIILFGVMLFCMTMIDILAMPNILNFIYTILFFGIVFTIFFLMTRSYFTHLQAQTEVLPKERV